MDKESPIVGVKDSDFNIKNEENKLDKAKKFSLLGLFLFIFKKGGYTFTKVQITVMGIALIGISSGVIIYKMTPPPVEQTPQASVEVVKEPVAEPVATPVVKEAELPHLSIQLMDGSEIEGDFILDRSDFIILKKGNKSLKIDKEDIHKTRVIK